MRTGTVRSRWDTLPVSVDPPVRADNLCAVCESPLPRSKHSRRYAGVQLDVDPFCSTDCCRAYHDVPRPLPVTDRQLAAARDSAARFRASAA